MDKLTPKPVPAHAPETHSEHSLSVVVPLYNEAGNVAPLLENIQAALAAYAHPWELVLVDDGSSDDTPRQLEQALARGDGRLRVLTLQRNFGQTAAMQAGIDAARGAIIATMDGDLQNDPADIIAMVERLTGEGLDLVAGWRRDRKDNLWLRTIPSRIANRLIGRVTGVRLHDYGCSLKVFRGTVLKGVRLFGEMHRFIPAWISVNTSPSRITEHVVHHHARVHGESKYGITRTYRVLVDLLSVYFFLRFLTRPGHFFGRIGMVFGFLGGLILAYLFTIKIFLGEDIGTRPLLMAGVLLMVVAVQFLTTGILAELSARTYFASSGGRPYAVRQDSGNSPLPAGGRDGSAQ